MPGRDELLLSWALAASFSLCQGNYINHGAGIFHLLLEQGMEPTDF